MTDEIWSSTEVRCLGVRLNGDAINEVNERGDPIVGSTLLLLLNGGGGSIQFSLPEAPVRERWDTLLDTADPWAPPRRLRAGDRYQLHARSMAVLELKGVTDVPDRLADWGPAGVY
jgi:glycogen operon protein